jgi:hypothetical protein
MQPMEYEESIADAGVEGHGQYQKVVLFILFKWHSGFSARCFRRCTTISQGFFAVREQASLWGDQQSVRCRSFGTLAASQ